MFILSDVVCAKPTTVAPMPLGDINPNVTQENIYSTVCVPNYSKSIRPKSSYTNKLKLKQMQQFNLSGLPSDYEEDHFISLSLGGHPTSENNLWPQYELGNSGALKKDKLETFLHSQLCKNKISLKQAQLEVGKDWYKYYKKYKL